MSILFYDLYTFFSPKPILIFFQSTMNCARIPLLDQKCDSEKKILPHKRITNNAFICFRFYPKFNDLEFWPSLMEYSLEFRNMSIVWTVEWLSPPLEGAGRGVFELHVHCIWNYMEPLISLTPGTYANLIWI